MTDKELKKLNRAELLELLLIQTREIERLNTQVEELQAELNQRKITLVQAGNIAEAALKLNHVFEAAQAAADQYLLSVTNPAEDTQKQCAEMLEQTRQQCQQMTLTAHQHAMEVWRVIRQEIYNPKLDYEQWLKITEYIDTQLKQE